MAGLNQPDTGPTYATKNHGEVEAQQRTNHREYPREHSVEILTSSKRATASSPNAEFRLIHGRSEGYPRAYSEKQGSTATTIEDCCNGTRLAKSRDEGQRGSPVRVLRPASRGHKKRYPVNGADVGSGAGSCGKTTLFGGGRALGRQRPLGKSNAKPESTENASGSRNQRHWNASSSCGDLSMSLIEKDMEWASRMMPQNTTPTIPRGPRPQRTVMMREKRRPPPRPRSSTSTRMATPSGELEHQFQGGDGTQIAGHATSRPSCHSPAVSKGIRTPESKRGTFKWNASTRIDDLSTDALLRKHPGWDTAFVPHEGNAHKTINQERSGVQRRPEGGGTSSARTITTREDSTIWPLVPRCEQQRPFLGDGSCLP